MKIKLHLGLIGAIAVAFAACQSKPADNKDCFLENEIQNMVAQHTIQTDIIEKSGKILNPRTIKDGKVKYIRRDDWCSGFFPGSMWLDYDLTKDEKWKGLAAKYTEDLDTIKYLKWHHDVGFMIGCSYLTGYRLTKEPAYVDVIVEAAKSLSTRYRKDAKVIQSWDADKGWQGKRGWECPVIIDNMMNLELLFEATALSGDSTFYNIAVNHANSTMANHFREDNSCYHVVDYALADGSVRSRQTAQGYAHESAWARGQAWAIYGFTTCYRYTGDQRYLEQAEKTLQFYLNDENLPEDLIPYWDLDAPKIPNEPRDVSAAACIASALYEMDGYCPEKGYKAIADKIVTTLATPAYKAEVGTNGNFILMHSVGSIPHGAEIDVPLNYADYYYQEALIRKRNVENAQPLPFKY